MHIGIQLHAPMGYELLERNITYHFLRSDSISNQVMMVCVSGCKSQHLVLDL